MRAVLAGFLIFLFLCAFSALQSLGQVTVESSLHMFQRGFDNSREESEGSVDRILLPESSVRVSFPLPRKGSLLTVGYRNSYILESQLSFLMSGKAGSVELSGGVLLGFLNELPLSAVPGLTGMAEIPLGKLFSLSLHASTSVYIFSFFSLSPGNAGFDQNTLGGAFAYRTKGAKLSLSFDRENLTVESETKPLKNNSLDVYEISISTDTGDFWLDSTTGLGVEIADTEVGASHQQYGVLFAEETLLFKLRKIEITAGIKSSILNFTAKDLKGAGTPKAPTLGMKSGVRFTL